MKTLKRLWLRWRIFTLELEIEDLRREDAAVRELPGDTARWQADRIAENQDPIDTRQFEIEVLREELEALT